MSDNPKIASTSRLSPQGHENLSSTPILMPLGMKRPETLAEQVQRLVRTSVSEYAKANGHETFEESEDFDVDDDLDFATPYETFFDPILGKDISAAEMHANQAVYKQQYLDEQAEEQKNLDLSEVMSSKNKATHKKAKEVIVKDQPKEPTQ